MAAKKILKWQSVFVNAIENDMSSVICEICKIEARVESPNKNQQIRISLYLTPNQIFTSKYIEMEKLQNNSVKNACEEYKK